MNSKHQFQPSRLQHKVLSDTTIPDEQKNYATLSKMIIQETERLSFQVEKILQMAIIERGKVKFKFTEINVHSYIKQIIQSFELKIIASQAKFSIQLDAEHFIIYADKLHFSNIIYNLIDNALKYSDNKPVIKISTFNNSNNY